MYFKNDNDINCYTTAPNVVFVALSLSVVQLSVHCCLDVIIGQNCLFDIGQIVFIV